MQQREIEVNGQRVIAFSDGSILRPGSRFKKCRELKSFGTKDRLGYIRVGINGKTPRMQRIIAKAFLPDYDESMHVDHIDGNPSNNKLSNLRMVTCKDNLRASCKPRPKASSQFRGVSKTTQTGCWLSQIYLDGKNCFIGNFANEVEAALSYDVMALANGFLPESLNFRVRDAQRLLLLTLYV